MNPAELDDDGLYELASALIGRKISQLAAQIHEMRQDPACDPAVLQSVKDQQGAYVAEQQKLLLMERDAVLQLVERYRVAA
jgi:hypothetical protein